MKGKFLCRHPEVHARAGFSHEASPWFFHVDGWDQSTRGEVATSWTRKDGVLTLEVTVPANTTAMIDLTGVDRSRLTEGGRPLEEVRDVKRVDAEREGLLFLVGLGVYRFACPMN